MKVEKDFPNQSEVDLLNLEIARLLLVVPRTSAILGQIGEAMRAKDSLIEMTLQPLVNERHPGGIDMPNWGEDLLNQI